MINRFARDAPASFSPDTHGPCLVIVSVDWCPHCRSAKPVLDRVAQGLGTAVPTYVVNGDSRKDLVAALGVDSFPTILFVDDDGNVHKYADERTFDGITTFAAYRHKEVSRA